MEIAKLSHITEKAQKLEEAAKIREELNMNFSKQTEQKLIQKMESNKENRAAQLNNLLEKLRKTVSAFNFNFFSNFCLQEQTFFVLQDNKIAQIKDMTTKETHMLEEKIKNKLIAAEENRMEKISSITERLKEHVNITLINFLLIYVITLKLLILIIFNFLNKKKELHVEEVRKATTNNKEELEEKIIQKLQNALNYRSEQLEIMKEKIRDHVSLFS